MKFHLPIILALSLLAGCAIAPGEAKRYTSEIRTRAGVIQADAKRLHPTTQDAVIVQDILDNADAQIVASDAADRVIDSAGNYINHLESKYDRQSGTIGVKLENLAWFGLYGCVGFWVLMRIVVPMLDPTSKLGKIATEALPLMNGAIKKVESVGAKLVSTSASSVSSETIVTK